MTPPPSNVREMKGTRRRTIETRHTGGIRRGERRRNRPPQVSKPGRERTKGQNEYVPAGTPSPPHNLEPRLQELKDKVNSLTTETAVNWALKEMEVLRRTILVKEVTELKSMEELKTLQNHLRRCQGKYWEETFPLSK